uniref:(northern house mosquito) hypothetical protein n=1 Tax=Culex pipiens TaxID=7175 RepID=A0A8D8PIM4_CULPI
MMLPSGKLMAKPSRKAELLSTSCFQLRQVILTWSSSYLSSWRNIRVQSLGGRVGQSPADLQPEVSRCGNSFCSDLVTSFNIDDSRLFMLFNLSSMASIFAPSSSTLLINAGLLLKATGRPDPPKLKLGTFRSMLFS